MALRRPVVRQESLYYQPKQGTIRAKSLKTTPHSHCLFPPIWVIWWSLLEVLRETSNWCFKDDHWFKRHIWKKVEAKLGLQWTAVVNLRWQVGNDQAIHVKVVTLLYATGKEAQQHCIRCKHQKPVSSKLDRVENHESKCLERFDIRSSLSPSALYDLATIRVQYEGKMLEISWALSVSKMLLLGRS